MRSSERKRVPQPAAPHAVTGAACGYWERRGIATAPAQALAAPSAPLLLLATLASVAASAPPGETGHGTVLLPSPCPAWYATQARLLGRRVRRVATPAECGGVPDPVALLETVRRARAEGERPRVLVVSIADDVTGTAVPPELLHEVCEAAADEGLLVVSDESWRDASHDTHGTVTVSPAEMLHGTVYAGSVVVLVELGAALLPPGGRTGLARFPDTERGEALHAGAAGVLRTLRAEPTAQAEREAAEALAEPPALRTRRTASAALHGALARALHGAVTAAGAVCRPPRAARGLYADFEPRRGELASAGVADAPRLEAALISRLGPYVQGGHRFGDDPAALRVRLSTDALAAGLPPEAWDAVPAADPLEEPAVAEALAAAHTALGALTDGSSAR